MKTKLLALMVLTGSFLCAGTRVSIGVAVGGPAYGYYPPPEPPVVVYAPPCPGPDYTWVEGTWYWAGPHRYWRRGYWAPPRFHHPHYFAPRYYERDRGFHRGWGHEREHYREGYREHRRDYDRGHGRDHYRGRRD